MCDFGGPGQLSGACEAEVEVQVQGFPLVSKEGATSRLTTELDSRGAQLSLISSGPQEFPAQS